MTAEDTGKQTASPPQWLRPMRDRVRGLPGGALAWQIGVAVLGGLIVVGGLLLIPLPGPGWAIVFLGLAVWATEFVWAQRLLKWGRGVLAAWTDWVKRQSRVVQGLLGLAGLLLLAALAWFAWWYLHR